MLCFFGLGPLGGGAGGSTPVQSFLDFGLDEREFFWMKKNLIVSLPIFSRHVTRADILSAEHLVVSIIYTIPCFPDIYRISVQGKLQY